MRSVIKKERFTSGNSGPENFGIDSFDVAAARKTAAFDSRKAATSGLAVE